MKKAIILWTIIIIQVLFLYNQVHAQYQNPQLVAWVGNTFQLNAEITRYAENPLDESFVDQFQIYGSASGQSEFTRTTGEGFDKVLDFNTKGRVANVWDIEVNAKTKNPVLEGDVLFISFYMRTLYSKDESGAGFAHVYFQQASPPWSKSVHQQVTAAGDWVHYKIPFVSQQDFLPGEASLNFGLGFGDQHIQIADPKLVNFGQNVAKDVLPRTSFSYDGREADAGWRQAALDRIEKHRKGDFKVIVKDKTGNPIPGAEVKVEMLRHQYGFGNIVSRKKFGSPTAFGEQYRGIVKENFNMVTAENAFKHKGWLQIKKEGKLDEFLKDYFSRMDDYNITLRGHALVWPHTDYTPVDHLIDKPEELRKYIRDHVEEITKATRGKFVDWDVVNEPFRNHQFMDILGEEEILEWFRIADKNAPETKLYINETKVIVNKGATESVQDNLIRLVKLIKANNVRIDGVGLQGHFSESGLTSPDKLMQILDRYHALGLEVKVTEFDVDTKDQDLQADYTRDFYTLVFSHPATNGIVAWGFWEKDHWRPDAAMYTSDWKIKPNGEVFKDLVYNQWWTKNDSKSNSEGVSGFRGFYGDYNVTVNYEGETATQEVSFLKDGSSIIITLK